MGNIAVTKVNTSVNHINTAIEEGKTTVIHVDTDGSYVMTDVKNSTTEAAYSNITVGDVHLIASDANTAVFEINTSADPIQLSMKAAEVSTKRDDNMCTEDESAAAAYTEPTSRDVFFPSNDSAPTQASKLSATTVSATAVIPPDERCHDCQRSNKKIRTVLTDTQEMRLKEVFSKTPYVTKQGVLELAESLDLEPQVINVWFRNLRARIKRQACSWANKSCG